MKSSHEQDTTRQLEMEGRGAQRPLLRAQCAVRGNSGRSVMAIATALDTDLNDISATFQFVSQ